MKVCEKEPLGFRAYMWLGEKVQGIGYGKIGIGLSITFLVLELEFVTRLRAHGLNGSEYYVFGALFLLGGFVALAGGIFSTLFLERKYYAQILDAFQRWARENPEEYQEMLAKETEVEQ
jgi:hypothetical protein